MPPPRVEVNGIDYVPMTWDGLVMILNRIYPADIFTGSSGDLGPKLITLLREIDKIKQDEMRENLKRAAGIFEANS